MKTLKEGVKNIANSKVDGHGWTTLKKFQNRSKLWGFENLLSYKLFFKAHFNLLFVTFDVMLGKYFCWTRGCDFVIYKKFVR